MPGHLAVVADGLLYLPNDPDGVRIAVDSDEWFAWLEQPATRSFAFRHLDGGFTARKERRQRGAHYWIAYRKVAGKLRNVYLGKSPVLTRECLTRAAETLAAPHAPQQASFPVAAYPAHLLSPGLLATKLYVPAVPPHLIPRSRLVEQLQLGVARKLTLISAPGGFGKTTLVSAWRATPAGSAVPVAWVSLDTTDREPARFWSYVSAALDHVLPGVGSEALALLQSAHPPAIEIVLLALLNAMSALRIDAVLVLEDYHAVDVAPIHDGVAFLLDHLPPRLHLVIITRADPPLPLARLRARSDLIEVRAADLRCTSEEATHFLAEAMGLALSTGEVALVEARTEGWIAGLQFAALALRGQTETERFVAAFSGSNRFVMDYLIEEVLTRQPPHLQQFLLHTAILERMCGPLCDAVMLGSPPPGRSLPSAPPLGITNDGAVALTTNRNQPVLDDSFSQAVLDELERRNLFLVPLDDQRGWYRYHHLFADVLRQRLLSGAGPAFVAALHGRAATWHEQVGLIVEAMEHALAASDWSHAACMIERHGTTYIFQGQVGVVLRWLSRLPDSFVRMHPRLCLIDALGRGDMGQLDAAEARLQDAERSVRNEGSGPGVAVILGEVALTRAMLARSRGDIERCGALSRDALRLLPPNEAARRAAATLNLARSYLHSGDVTDASERLACEAIEPIRASGNRPAHLSALTNLARIQVLQGRLHVAATTYRRATEIPTGPGGLKALGSGAAAYYLGLSCLHYEWNELHLAEEYLAAGMELVHGPLTIDADVVALGYTTQARLYQARSDGIAARAALEALVAVARARSFASHIAVKVAALHARLTLASGDLDAAVRWADQCRPDLQHRASLVGHTEGTTLARVRIAQVRLARNAGRPDDLGTTLQLLDGLAANAEANGRLGHVIEALMLCALALDAQGDGRGAIRVLERVLLLAAPEGYVRRFIDEGVPMAALLRRVRQSRITPVYVAMLLQAFHTGVSAVPPRSAPRSSAPLPPPGSVLEPPTPRELDVLRLIAAGKSNAEIAQTLFIAVSTVRTHTNNLFGKLGATRRTEAVARARELGLL